MELQVSDVKGIPLDCIVSVRAGQTRRQAPLRQLSEKSLKFPEQSAASQQLKIDLFQPLATELLVLHPSVSSYTIGLSCSDRTPSSSSACSFRLALDRRGASGAQHVSADKAAGEKQASGDMQHYLEKFKVLQYVQSLLQALVEERPEDPFEFLWKQLGILLHGDRMGKQKVESAKPMEPDKPSAREHLAPEKEGPQPPRGGQGPCHQERLQSPPTPIIPAVAGSVEAASDASFPLEASQFAEADLHWAAPAAKVAPAARAAPAERQAPAPAAAAQPAARHEGAWATPPERPAPAPAITAQPTALQERLEKLKGQCRQSLEAASRPGAHQLVSTHNMPSQVHEAFEAQRPADELSHSDEQQPRGAWQEEASHAHAAGAAHKAIRTRERSSGAYPHQAGNHSPRAPQPQRLQLDVKAELLRSVECARADSAASAAIRGDPRRRLELNPPARRT